MIKKILCGLLVVMMICCHIERVDANVTLANGAQSAILIDAESHQVLYSKNEADKLYPASTTKIMTMILLFEAIKNKTIKWDDILTCSAYAASMGGSQVYLEENETMSVDDLFKSIAIASANDACVVVGEAIGGSIENFVKMMNEKAKELHLQNTHFMNATGLHDPDHYTCAKDLATMAAYLIDLGGKKLFSVTSLYDSYIREDTKQKFWLVNTNKLLKQYPGVDGLKTGYTKQAGYCIVTTCQKDNMRLIGVLMKEEEPKVRNSDMCELLNYGYSHFSRQTLYKKGDVVDQYQINTTDMSQIDVITKQTISYLKQKSDNQKIKKEIKYQDVELPITKDKKIGQLNLKKDNEIIASYDLYSLQEVEKTGFFKRVYKVYKGLM